MSRVERCTRFVQKAEAALVSAIEVYNKPDFKYREETFAILAINAWELLLKARLLALNGNDPKCLYVYEARPRKSGGSTKKKYLKRNRSGNCYTVALGQAILALERKDSAPDSSIRRNLDALIEIRDNAVHYLAAGPLLAKQTLEVGTASIENFVKLSRLWFKHDLSRYYLYLMPLGFLAPQKDAAGIVATSDEAHLVKYLAALMQADNAAPSGQYHAALAVEIKMKRSPAEGAARVVITDDPDATPVFLTEEDFKKKYSWDYAELTERLKKRYCDFKITKKYHKIRNQLKKESKYCMSRYLDPGNPKSAKKDFYNPNVISEFDKHYKKA